MSSIPPKSELIALPDYLTTRELDELDALLAQTPNEYNNAASFFRFKRDIYKRYQRADHLDAIDEALMQAVMYVESEGQDGRGFQIINMPPRHGKTLTISRLFPPYVLGMHPDWRVILSSYGATLAYKNSRAARNIIQSPVYQQWFPRVQLAEGSRAVDAWDIAGHEGGLDAMGVGGGVTGKGGQIIIIDDPVKSREEAESETYRDKVWDWFTDDLYTRREPYAAIILMMTRWHMDDLAGRCLNEEPDKWHVLSLPAKAEANDPLGRVQGEALWQERYPVHVLNDIEETLAPYSFAALYQQSPVPAEGGLFKRSWFAIVRDKPESVFAARFWDLAMSEKTAADYTVGVRIEFCKDGHYYVTDVARAQLEWGDVTPFLADVIMRDGSAVAQGVEEKGFMSRAITELNADPRLHGYSIMGYPVDTDKLRRALPFAAKLAAGHVSLLQAHWNQAYIEELCSFPSGVNDDQVDSSSGAWAMQDAQSLLYGAMHYG